jgi:hypothetical protein
MRSGINGKILKAGWEEGSAGEVDGSRVGDGTLWESNLRCMGFGIRGMRGMGEGINGSVTERHRRYRWWENN